MIIDEANEVAVDEKLTSKYAKALKNAAWLAVLGEEFDAKDVVTCFAVEAASTAPRHGVLKLLAKQYSRMNDEAVESYLKGVEVVKGRRPEAEKPAPKRRGRPPKNGAVAQA